MIEDTDSDLWDPTEIETTHFIQATQSEFLVKSREIQKIQPFVMWVPVMGNALKKRIDIDVIFTSGSEMSIESEVSIHFKETNVRVQLLTADKEKVVLDQVKKLSHLKCHLHSFKLNVKFVALILRLSIEPIVHIHYPAKAPSDFLSTMLERSILTDFVIKTNSKDFSCHKVVLAGRSEFFLRMFQSDMKEARENVLDWRGIYLGSTIETFLGFIYNAGGKRVISVDNCFELFQLAHLSLMDDLQRACIPVMKRLIDPDRAVPTLQLALKYKLETLKIFALNYIVKTFDQCKETSAWKELSRDDTMLTAVFEAMDSSVTHFR